MEVLLNSNVSSTRSFVKEKPIVTDRIWEVKSSTEKRGERKTFKSKEVACHKKPTITAGTIFENPNVSLSTWFAVIYPYTSREVPQFET